ncbi:MAG TPA: bifunctional heptose 7-phosphate kinase/heptose 1-phosphate adenyltransferase [Gammaproteobacteria bacterium]|jgi:D-beta-D-heptose 7-phosphate kinase/D-beta-D-heptose 1-phosphate adenosyltransferase|nr:bifunctional heptose 7-phosphate kinase/heptose 1-phosphate adenyltransferase [Gammaproteobacteria bacterium]
MQLPSLQSVHVLVVGDVMLDRYWRGPARRVSPEAPVPVIDVEQVDERPGGAANVALNVASLGARVTLVGAVGEDTTGDVLEARLRAAGVECRFLRVADWQTALKLRVVSQNQQLLRADFERPLPTDHSAALLEQYVALLPAATVVVLQDYDKGVLAHPAAFIAHARAAGVPVIVDPKHKPFSCYAGADVLKPNMQEFTAAFGASLDESDLALRARTACNDLDLNAMVITRGARGMSVIERSGGVTHLPALPAEVYDVTGAGDTAAAALAVTRSLGWEPPACARVANVASGLAVGKSGTAAVTGPELARALAGGRGSDRGILSQQALLDAVTAARTGGARIVFTNGCFDILHAGHVAYLEEARARGDRLIVAVNDDDSVRRLKGLGRPVNPLERRQRVLAGLASVDWVTSFADDTPEALLAALRPDVLVKGGDYAADGVVGADLVRSYGGSVAVLSLVDDCSTTAIVDRIQSER